MFQFVRIFGAKLLASGSARHLTPSGDPCGAPHFQAVVLGEGHANAEDLFAQVSERDQVDSLRAVVAGRLWYSAGKEQPEG